MRTTLLSLLVLSCVAPQKRPDETLGESDSGDMESESSTDTGPPMTKNQVNLLWRCPYGIWTI